MSVAAKMDDTAKMGDAAAQGTLNLREELMRRLDSAGGEAAAPAARLAGAIALGQDGGAGHGAGHGAAGVAFDEKAADPRARLEAEIAVADREAAQIKDHMDRQRAVAAEQAAARRTGDTGKVVAELAEVSRQLETFQRRADDIEGNVRAIRRLATEGKPEALVEILRRAKALGEAANEAVDSAREAMAATTRARREAEAPRI